MPPALLSSASETPKAHADRSNVPGCLGAATSHRVNCSQNRLSKLLQTLNNFGIVSQTNDENQFGNEMTGAPFGDPKHLGICSLSGTLYSLKMLHCAYAFAVRIRQSHSAELPKFCFLLTLDIRTLVHV